MASPIDELYRSIYGELPPKAGVAYEQLATAVLTLLSDSGSVKHDAKMRGALSKSLYQIDVLREKEDQTKIAGEAKDYTDRGGKVGRGDLQKLAGALPDIDVTGGLFISATDFTKPARQYAAAAEDLVGKPISLFHIRPVTETDFEGRLKKITFCMHITTPDYSDARFVPVFTDEGLARLRAREAAGTFTSGQKDGLDAVYRVDGSVLITIHDLTAGGFGSHMDLKAFGSWVLPEGFIRVGGESIPIHGISYAVKMREEIEEIVVEKSGRVVLLAKSDDGDVDTLIREDDLKNIKFGDNGLAERRDRNRPPVVGPCGGI